MRNSFPPTRHALLLLDLGFLFLSFFLPQTETPVISSACHPLHQPLPGQLVQVFLGMGLRYVLHLDKAALPAGQVISRSAKNDLRL